MTEEQGVMEIDPLIMMESILDKLKTLDYETLFLNQKSNTKSEGIALYPGPTLPFNPLIKVSSLYTGVLSVFGYLGSLAPSYHRTQNMMSPLRQRRILLPK